MDYYTGIAEMDEGLDARFEILSPSVRHLLKGEAIPILATDLASKYGLDDEMQRGLETETALVLMYIEPVEDFAANLMTEYLIPPEAALEIAHEIGEKLFAPLASELGHASELEQESAEQGAETSVLDPERAPQAVAATETPAPTAAHVPIARVMPQSPSELPHDPRASTELPHALLQNLKASLMHSLPEEQTHEPLEGTQPAASYNAILNTKSPPPPTS